MLPVAHPPREAAVCHVYRTRDRHARIRRSDHQIKLAFANPLPLVIGTLIGALVPIATCTVGHAELDTAGWGSVPGAIVIGGYLFSVIAVYKWGRRAFDSVFKVMSFSHVAWLSMSGSPPEDMSREAWKKLTWVFVYPCLSRCNRGLTRRAPSINC
jgi:hypothetical protein